MQYLREYGEHLAELGYRIVPLPPGSKGPHRRNWQHLNADAAQVRKWYQNGSADDGIGILAATAPAIDVDVMDPEIAQAMSDAIDAIFPGVALMTRTGMAPKFLIPFRADEPFRKLTSATYTDGTHDHKVEILADGQQWVAYHIHPVTGKPFAWFDGITDDGIRSVPLADLPVLDVAHAQAVIDAFEAIAADMVAKGLWQRKSPTKLEPADRPGRADADPFAAHAQPVGCDVPALLARIPNADCDYDRWFQVMAAVHHETGGEGREIAYQWSTQSAKHTDERFDTCWGSLGRSGARPVTIRSLLKEITPKGPQRSTTGLSFVHGAKFSAASRVEWHIKHVLPKAALSILYGEPGAGKSFFALDMAMAIARGVEWRGHKVRQATVAYIAAEGVSGFGNRMQAYATHHALNLADIPLYVHGGSFLLKDQVLGTAQALRELGAQVVVIDTLAAVSPGANENTSEDMGLLIDAANQIIETTGAAVILIHHANKQGVLRGWSGLLAAADQTIRMDRQGDARTAYLEKMKEGKDDGQYSYKLLPIHLYQDEDGDSVTSCVCVTSEDVAPKHAKKGKRDQRGEFETSATFAKARHYLSIILDLVATDGPDITEQDVIQAIQDDPEVNPLQEPGHPKAANIKRTLITLADAGKITKDGSHIRVSEG